MLRRSQDPERFWDKFLKIRTSGRDDTRADQFRYPYEPTPYLVLQRLAESGWIRKGDVLLDYGAGKGRAGLFLSSQTGCRSIGVEYDDRLYLAACENKARAVAGEKTEFVLADAVNYEVPPEVDRIFFFNPFSVEILEKALARVLESVYQRPRTVRLFFYYPSFEYIGRLMQVEELEFVDEIDCRDIFGEDERERIVIFRTTTESGEP